MLKLHQHGVQLVLKGRPRHEQGMVPYRMYLQHLITKLPVPTTAEQYCAPYRDFLQAPLQPLMGKEIVVHVAVAKLTCRAHLA